MIAAPSRFLAFLQRGWQGVCRAGRVLLLCRFALVTLGLVSVALVLVPQGLDLLRFVDESLPRAATADAVRSVGAGTWTPAAWFLFALWIWALSAWYFSRFILAVLLRPRLASDVWLVRWMPRWIGLSCFVALALGLARVGAWGLVVVTCTGGALFLAAAIKAGDWLRRRGVLMPAEQSGQGLRALPNAARRLATVFACLAFALFVAFTLSPVRLPQLVGAAAIVMLAASTWIPFGTFLVYLGHRSRLPVLSVLALLLAVFSFWNDNHALRRTTSVPLPAATASLRDDLAAWVTARAAGQDARTPIPLVIVVTEGGGARAAYWTAHVLAALEEAAPGFSRHVYAISGVSGGAVGAAVFAALMAEGGEWPRALMPSACHDRAAPVTLDEAARCVAGSDVLSPALAGLLYPDLMARFSPWPIAAFDRSRAIEGAWERAWENEVTAPGAPSSRRFDAPLRALWTGTQAAAVPNLILNGTWVETGQRAITTNLRLVPWPFEGAVDVLGELGSDVPLATAAHAAARFPLISPAGRVDRVGRGGRGGRAVGHVVDGGYFENAGATAALELLDGVTWLRDLHELPLRVVVIAISNDPAADPSGPGEPLAGPAGSVNRCGDPPPARPPALRGLDVRAPLVTVLNARDARGQFALQALESYTLADRDRGHDTWFVRFGLRQLGPEPLGWQLSRAARSTIADQLGDPAAPFCNSQGVRDVVTLLAPPVAQAAAE